MQGTVNGLATMLWIVILVGVLAIYFVVFLILKGFNMIGSIQAPEKERGTVTDGTELVDSPKTLFPSAEVEHGLSKSPLADPSSSPTSPIPAHAVFTPNNNRTIFGEGVLEEFVFDFCHRRAFYSVTVDQDEIKTSRIRATFGGQRQVAYDKEHTQFPANVKVYSKSAPISMVSHLETCDVTVWPSIWGVLFKLWWYPFRFVEHNAVFLLSILMVAAAIICFYVPGTFNSNYSHSDSTPVMSYNLTAAIFFLTLGCTILHLIYFRTLMKKSKTLAYVGVAAFVFLLIALALSISLMDIAFTNGGKKKSSGGETHWQNAVNQFNCYCDKNSSTIHPTLYPTAQPTYSLAPSPLPTVSPTMSEIPTLMPTVEPSEAPTFVTESPTEAPTYSMYPTAQPTTHFPTAKPTTQFPTVKPTSPFPTRMPTNGSIPWDNSYSFECTFDQYAASNYNSCDMNCGVCGQTYYAPFVSYATFTMCYLLLILYLAFLTAFEGHNVWAGFIMVDGYHPSTHMFVVIHGSLSFGFPLYTRMTYPDYVKLNRFVKDVVKRGKDAAKATQGGTDCYMNHMARVSSGVLYHRFFNGTWFNGWFNGY